MKKSFGGFSTPNYTMTPNEVFDVLLPMKDMREAELRVIMAAVRVTFGFHLENEAVELSERFLAGRTGLDRSTCRSGLGAAVHRGVLEVVSKGRRATRNHPGASARYRVRFAAIAQPELPEPQEPEMPKPPEKNGNGHKPKEEPQLPNEQAAMVGALATVLGWDSRMKGILGQLFKPAAELRRLGYTPQQVLDCFGVNSPWYKKWPGNLGQKPRINDVMKGLPDAVAQSNKQLVIED